MEFGHIVGRKSEIEQLKRALQSKEPEFIAITGRRRIGKTFLVRHYFNDSFYFFMTGLPDGTVKEHMERFFDALSDTGYKGAMPDNWMHAFISLANQIKASNSKRKKVIFLDEIPWMDSQRSKFVQALDYFWNSFACMRSDILLIVCGSATSWMSKNILKNRKGLHRRVTNTIHLRPFTLWEVREYFKYLELELDEASILESYQIFGGIPYYLRLFNPGYGVPQIVDTLLFSPFGPLKDEFSEVYTSLFSNSRLHIDIIKAICAKRRGVTQEQLCESLGIKGGGSLSEALNNLILGGFVRINPPFGRANRGATYQICDPFTAFHLDFIEGKKVDVGYFSKIHTSTRYNAWKGYAFETVCLLHTEEIKQALGIGGINVRVSGWSVSNESGGAQIDLIFDRTDSIINIFEIKNTTDPFIVAKSVWENVQTKIGAFRENTKTKKAIHPVLISASGARENAYSKNFARILTLEDLFKPPIN